jgi:hypothetical protein
VHACPRCGNPVLPAAAPAPAPRAGPAARAAAAPPGEAGGAPEAPRGRPRWAVAGLAFVVLGAAYVGAYLLLTAEARKDRAALAVAWPGLASATDPGPPPPGDDARAVAAWRPRNELWEKRRLAESLDRRVSTVRTSLFAALGVQTLITALLLAKASARRPAPRETGARGRRS